MPSGAHTYYLAVAGDDQAACTQSAPCLTFERGTRAMAPGDALVLLDGRYTEDTHGSLALFTEDGNANARAGAMPSGLDADHPSVVRAQNPGQVDINGALRLGLTRDKTRYVYVYGLTFHKPSAISNGDNNVIKSCGFEGGLSLGSIDHSLGTMHNVVEDSFMWGADQRAMVTVYRAHHNTLRRLLIRHDGCAEDYCGWGPGNYSVGITVYNSHDNTLENVVMLDRILGDNPYGYADFATAQHDSNQPDQPEGERLGRNAWLGCMSVNSEDAALVFEADAVESGTTATIRDFVALASAGGVSLDGSHRPFEGTSTFDVDGIAIHAKTQDQSTLYLGCDVVQDGDPGCAHSLKGVVETAYAAPMASALPKMRYGSDTPLWPWPEQDRIKLAVCAAGSGARGLCTGDHSLTDYIHSY